MLTSFDGGITAWPSQALHFSVHAGTDDRKVRSTTRLLVTLFPAADGTGDCQQHCRLVPVTRGGRVLHMSPVWRPQAIFWFRTLGILVTTLFIHTLFQQVLNARQRWAWSTFASPPLICCTSSGSWS